MERHLLLTVSEQQSAFSGVRFLGGFFQNKDELRITLFYTAPRPAAVWDDERTPEQDDQAKEQARRFKEKGYEALDRARQMLCGMGWSEELIETKLQFRQFNKVKDIVQETLEGKYDAVVLGRRGLSWVEELFSESVSKDLLDMPLSFPIWFCRRPGNDSRDVLLCLDGSDAAFRMADHVGFMLAPESAHRVTLMVVNRSGEFTSEELDRIFKTGKEQLMENGFPEALIQTRTVDGSNVVKAVLEEAKAGKYASVAVGRRATQGGLQLGSVSKKLFRELEETALWISY